MKPARPEISVDVYRKARLGAALSDMQICKWIERAIEEKFVKDFRESEGLNILVLETKDG